MHRSGKSGYPRQPRTTSSIGKSYSHWHSRACHESVVCYIAITSTIFSHPIGSSTSREKTKWAFWNSRHWQSENLRSWATLFEVARASNTSLRLETLCSTSMAIHTPGRHGVTKTWIPPLQKRWLQDASSNWNPTNSRSVHGDGGIMLLFIWDYPSETGH